jgi:uroporphyrinogen decarboxylase
MATQRERYKNTILFNNPDRIPLHPGHPRESTLAAWKSQGLPQDTDYMAAALGELGIDRHAALKFHGVAVSFRLYPEFEQVVLEHRDGHYVIRDWSGAITEISDQYDASYLKTAKDFVTRKWHSFPVKTQSDWAAMKTRYNSGEKARVARDAFARCADMAAQDHVISLNFNGVFWQLREWCGFENLCFLMADDPAFVHEMAQFWAEFVSDMLDLICRHITPDRVLISEDMAYKAHSMISPDMTRKFILPAYKAWIRKIKKSGCPVIEVDSDGYIEELIPIWIEAGVNCCSPVEVAAHCDIVKLRQKYGKSMAYMQGIDKRIMARGGKELETHVMQIVPALFADGGYIPGCDHGVPPDISWQNYLDFTRMLAQLSGWL